MLRQRHFRFRTDTGAVDATPTWAAAEDTNYVPGSAAFRLRFSIENPDAEATGSLPFQIYVSKNGGAYAPVTTSSTNGIKSIDAGSDADNTTIVIPRLTTPIWTPLAGAAIDLDFQRRRYYSSSALADIAPTSVLSISRASTGYAKTAAGTLTSFGTGTLRITDLGLLIEDARTNVCLFSQFFINGVTNWNTSHATPTDNQTAAPDGTTTAGKITSDASTNSQIIYQNASNASGTDTWSCFFKAAGFNFAYITAADNANANFYAAVISLTTGAVTATRSTGSPVSPSASAETFGNGWGRLSITMGGGSSFINMGPCDVASPASWDGNGRPIVAGDGSSGVYAWGAQVEAGAFASSYIPTTTTSATRAAENITITGAVNADINAAIASIVAQINGGGSTSYAANMVDSNGTNLLGFDATNHALASISASLATGNTANRTLRDKVGIAWSGAGRSLVLNGGTVATDATAQTPSATQNLGSQAGTSNFVYAYIERLTIWTSKLADATLQALTT